MIRCIVIDDEQVGIDIMTDHIGRIPELNLVQTYTDALKALDSIRQAPPDLIFLDIDMPGFSGLDFVEALRSKPLKINPRIIFTTGHDAYALQGFDHGITDFLLKPIGFKRFKIAVDRVIENMDQAIGQEKNTTFFFVESEGKKVKLDFSDIIYLEAAGNYVKIITLKENYIIYTSMSAIQKQLNENDFARVHNSFIISIPKIQSVTRNELVMNCSGKSKPIPIGNSFKDKLFLKLGI